MKRLTVLTLGLIFLIVSCGGTSPKNKVKEIMGAVQKGNLDEIKKIYPDYKAEEAETMKEGFSKITYTINKEEIKGNNAVVNMTVKTPDISPFLQEYMQKLMPIIMKELQSGKTQEEVQKNPEVKKIAEEFFKEKFKSPDLKYVENEVNVSLKKENGKWELDKENNEEFMLNVFTFGIMNTGK